MSCDDDQYGGAKAHLRPYLRSLTELAMGVGSDVEIAPKKRYVSLRRRRQFAMIQPTTSERIDVGINCSALVPTDRLEVAGSFSAMVSHRVRVTKVEEIDGELVRWLRLAYKRAQPLWEGASCVHWEPRNLPRPDTSRLLGVDQHDWQTTGFLRRRGRPPRAA